MFRRDPHHRYRPGLPEHRRRVNLGSRKITISMPARMDERFDFDPQYVALNALHEGDPPRVIPRDLVLAFDGRGLPALFTEAEWVALPRTLEGA